MTDRPTKRKPVHLAKLIRPDGRVSPLCAVTPRAINLRTATWTNRPEAVTCPRCLVTLYSSESEA